MIASNFNIVGIPAFPDKADPPLVIDPDTVLSTSVVHAERIINSILLIRSHKVMLDSDLAALYGVKTGALT